MTISFEDKTWECAPGTTVAEAFAQLLPPGHDKPLGAFCGC